jgi:hypothetical protein
MTNPSSAVGRQLVGAVQGRSRRRDHFGDPVRGELERCDIGQLRHATTSPAREVGNQDVRAETELGLDQGDPAVGADVEGAEHAAQSRGCARMPRRWPGPGNQRAAHDLGYEVARNLDELFAHRAVVRLLPI